MERKIKEWEHILLQLVRTFFLAHSLWLFIPWHNLTPLMLLSAGNYFSCFCKNFLLIDLVYLRSQRERKIPWFLWRFSHLAEFKMS